MKKLISGLAVATVLFTAVGINDADAYTRSSSRSSFSSHKSYSSHSTTRSYSTKSSTTITSKKSYNLKSPSTSKIKKPVTTTKKVTTSTTKPKVDLTKKSTTTTTKKTTTLPKSSTTGRKVTITKKTTTVNNHTVVYKKQYVSPPKRYSHSYYDSHYGHYPYYHNGSFTNQLITAAGVYLFLESFDDDGQPIYVDNDGNVASNNALAQAQPYQQGTSGWTIFFGVFSGILASCILVYVLFRIIRRK